MRRRAVTVVATQGISPVMAMLVALVIALILLLAAPVKAQETTAEETTVLAADAADRKVEAETDNVSAEVDNGKVSVSTDDGSSSDDGTGQQSSLTVQQNQTDEGSGSRASTGDVNIGASQTSSSSCQNRHEVASLDELDEGDTIDFRTQGNKFEVSYDVFFDSNASNRRFRIEIRRNGNVVDSEETSVDQTDATYFVSDGSDNYTIKATLSDAGPDPTFDVLVDDCRGSNNNNNNNDGRNRRHHRHHDRDRHRHHDRDRHHNRFFGRGAANQQYERIVEEKVIKETIPDKGKLAATGGVPLTGAAFLSLASVGLGVSVLRSAIRRDP
jgi:Tfp pilus assembly protein FimT